MKRIILYLSLVFSGFICIESFAQQRLEHMKIISREAWGSEEPRGEMNRHIPRYITIHHTATEQNLQKPVAEKLQALQRFSFSKGFLGDGTPKKAWADVPYHFYIAADGTIAEGRELQYEGASNTAYDLTGHALIVVEGNFQEENLTQNQRKSLGNLVTGLAQKYKIPGDQVSGHKDQAETSCPGDALYELLPELRKKVETLNNPRVLIGAEQLFSAGYKHLVQGKRVGLITNHTGLLPDGEHLIDALHQDPEVDLRLLFGPEHGLRGEKDTHVANATDPDTGLPIISLYGKQRKPGPELLEQVDVLVFDIQDIGARYYTYIKTMLNTQEAAAEAGIPFVVLDRPNPISGAYVDGPVGAALEPEKGIGTIPITHGMTVGELALMFNAERRAQGLPVAELTVVPLQNYQRDQWYDETGLDWIKPSPNMLTLQTATVYPATCLLEGTNFSEARGTMLPFERFGAPWVDGKELASKLNNYHLPGVTFRPVSFVPGRVVDGIEIYPPKFLAEQVQGVELVIHGRGSFESAKAGVYILHALKTLYPDKFEWRVGRIDGLLGTSMVRKKLDSGASPREITEQWEKELRNFREKRKKYLLY